MTWQMHMGSISKIVIRRIHIALLSVPIVWWRKPFEITNLIIGTSIITVLGILT